MRRVKKPKPGDLVYILEGNNQILQKPALYVAMEVPEVSNEWNGQASHKVFYGGEYLSFATYYYSAYVLENA